MTSQDLMNQTNTYVMTTYGRYPIALAKGKGVKVWDPEGKEYLDFLGGIAVSPLGHCHPAVVDAITKQATTLIHTSNLYYTRPGADLAKLLVSNGGLGKVFLCNSGAEANEGAFKLARKYQWRKGNKQKVKIISATHSFHGRTMATLAATPKPEIQEGFGPLPQGFAYAEFGDIESLRKLVDDQTAAVILEPVQGEGGIYPLSKAYLEEARRICSEAGALLIFDEVQCGLGRTGTFFAWQGYGVKPDILTMAKGLAGGLPLGAICATPDTATGFQPGDHATTFGANPVVCAAAIATVRTIVDGGLVEQAKVMGQYLKDSLTAVAARHPQLVKEVRGAGLMVGIELTAPAAPVLAKCHELGLLANVTAGTVLRFLPAYVVSREDIDTAVGIVEHALSVIA